MYRPLWLTLFEFTFRGYGWHVLYRIMRHLDTCRLPIKAMGRNAFGMVWFDALKDLALLAAGQQITIRLDKYDYYPEWGRWGPTGPHRPLIKDIMG
jgi:hypothetical protein